MRASLRRTSVRMSAILALVVAAPAARSTAVSGVQGADPDFGPNVTIFDPTTPTATIQANLDSVFKSQESSEFGPNRIALLFKPGTYKVDVRVGFYTQLSGLGLSPDEVVIDGHLRADARWRRGNATLNFWRVAENMSVNPPDGFNQWAVSQAAPMRRVHIRGDLVLSDGGWSSGGFLADSKVDGQVWSGSQQQWLTRNSELGSWMGSNWNMVFVGTGNAPLNSFPTPPYTTITSAPVIREKPFLYVDTRGEWKVFVPALRSNASRTTWSSGQAPGASHALSEFVIVKPGMSAAMMNDALAQNKNLIITPGIYHLAAPLHIARANTVVLGLGLATLVADNGVSAINVDDVDGVTIAGLLIEAGTINSPLLMQVGPPGSSANHVSNPTLLSDVFFRIGGAGVGKAAESLEINSNNVIGDHMWLWRADHGNGVGWTSNTAANGLVVNGNDVTIYGLFVEHYQQYQVQWNGNGGRTYFFQNEMPYDVPNQAEWMSGTTRGFAAYKVGPAVTDHEAWGLGSYCFFNRNPTVVADRAFEVPVAPNVRFHNMVTVSLGGGKGTIAHVINDSGPPAKAGASVQKLVSIITPIRDTSLVELFKDTPDVPTLPAPGQIFKLQTTSQRRSLHAIIRRERALWRAGKPPNYRFLLRVGCFCIGDQDWLLIDARSGQPLRAWDRTGTATALRHGDVFSVDDLYDQLENAAGKASEVQVAFDPRWHFPNYLHTSNAEIPDDWVLIEVRGLTPGSQRAR